ncbi:ion transporter [bacterium]|nr:ion transporter [bacterium]
MKIPVFKPHSPFKRVWNSIAFWLALYSGLIMPFNFVYSIEPTLLLRVLDILITLFFLFDMVMSMRTAYSRNGILIINQRSITLNYLKTWFCIDVIANFPYELFGFFIPSFTENGLPVLSLLGLPHTLRVFRAFRYLGDKQSDLQTLPVLVRLTRMVVVMLFTTHWIALGWYNISAWPENRASGWVCQQHLESTDIFTKYLYSLYWSVTALSSVGFGDITPQTRIEVLFATFVMIVGVAVFAYFIGNIASMISKIDAGQALFQERMDGVKEYLQYRKLPLVIRQRILNYYEFLWSRTKGFDERAFLQNLPRSLRRDIIHHLAVEILDRVPLFKGCGHELLDTLVTALQPQLYGPDEYLTRAGELANEVFFITDGHADVVDQEGTIHATLSKGDYFGELSLILSERRTVSTRARKYCDVYVLNKSDFQRILQESEEFKELFKQNAQKQADLVADLLMKNLVL